MNPYEAWYRGVRGIPNVALVVQFLPKLLPSCCGVALILKFRQGRTGVEWNLVTSRKMAQAHRRRNSAYERNVPYSGHRRSCWRKQASPTENFCALNALCLRALCVVAAPTVSSGACKPLKVGLLVFSNPTAPTIRIFLPHSQLRVTDCFVLPRFSPMQPDEVNWVDSEAGFIRSNCSMYSRRAARVSGGRRIRIGTSDDQISTCSVCPRTKPKNWSFRHSLGAETYSYSS